MRNSMSNAQRNLVTIVIPCYNAEDWIGEAIESALLQDWPQKEIIVIDDGSTDNSWKIIGKFSSYIKCFTGKNQGGGAARNKGIRLSCGSWIQFLDADDRLKPSCVKDKIEFKAASNCTVCSGVMPLGINNTEAPYSKFWSFAEWNLNDILKFGSPPTPSPLHKKKDLLLVGGFNEKLPCAQEFDLHLRLAIFLDRYFISNKKIGVEIRNTPDSVSRKGGTRMLRFIGEVLIASISLLEKTGKLTIENRLIISQRLTKLARNLFWLGEKEVAICFVNVAKHTHKLWYKQAYKNKLSLSLARTMGFENYETINCLRKRYCNYR